MTKCNEMILRVLQAKNKKDDKEAFNYVEKVLGFSVRKCDGFQIINGEKNLFITFHSWESSLDYIYLYSGQRRNSKIYRANFCKFDFYNYLTTPKNKEYSNLIANYGYVDTKYKRIIDRFKIIKDDIKRYEDYIEEEKSYLQSAMDKYAKRVSYDTSMIAKNKEKIKELRREYGLS